MPSGPKGEKRPADVIGNAVHVMRIATGEIEEGGGPETKAAAALGRKGGRLEPPASRQSSGQRSPERFAASRRRGESFTSARPGRSNLQA
jgi:hypothetical protein